MNMKTKPTIKTSRSRRPRNHNASLHHRVTEAASASLLVLLIAAAVCCSGHPIITDTNNGFDGVGDDERMMNDVDNRQQRRRLAMHRISSSGRGSNIQDNAQQERDQRANNYEDPDDTTSSSTQHRDAKSNKTNRTSKQNKWGVANVHTNKEAELPESKPLVTPPVVSDKNHVLGENNGVNNEVEKKNDDYSRSEEWGETNNGAYSETLPPSLAPPVKGIDILAAENKEDSEPLVIVELPYLPFDRSRRNVNSIADQKRKRIVTLLKSPNYSGEFNPVGTLDLMHYSNDSGGSSTVFVMNAQGLDPACGNVVIGDGDEVDTIDDSSIAVVDGTELPTVQPTSTTPTFSPTLLPTTSEPTQKPTVPPTAEPTSPPTSVGTTVRPTESTWREAFSFTPSPNNNNRGEFELFDPLSSLTEYKSAGCGPRGRDALANRAECPYGYRMVKEHILGQGGEVEVVAIINGCQYFSFRVFECLPPPITVRHRAGPKKLLRRNLLSLLPDDRNSSSDPYSFDPLSTLVGYISDNCGPRGKVALADLAQCQYGHEKVQWVPWNGNAVVKLDGCDYFSFEIYTCLPETLVLFFTEDHPLPISDPLDEFLSDFTSPPVVKIAAPAGDAEKQLRDIAACAVVVANGSCEEPGNNGFTLGTTNDHEFVAGNTLDGEGRTFYDVNELDGKVVLVHDHDGAVIGCGTIEDEPEPTVDCLCGFCADCYDSTSSTCNKRDYCLYNGNQSAKPHSIYLKTRIANAFLTQINVYFNSMEGQQPCQSVVDVDDNGLFHIVKPGYCGGDDNDNIVGSDLFIDFRGDSAPDAVIHTSCAVLIYAGMPIGESPFVIEGYCLSEDDGSCTHLDRESSQVCSTTLPV